MKYLDLTGLQKFWNKCKSAFVTKDENGNVTVESLQADDGIKCVGTLDVKEGYSARFWSNDNSKNASLRCDDNGKLSLNGNTVATLDDIPSGGGTSSGSSNSIPFTYFTCYSNERTVRELIDQLANEGLDTTDSITVIVTFSAMLSGTFLCDLNRYHNDYWGCKFTDLTNLKAYYFEGESRSLSLYDNLSNGGTSSSDSSIIDLGTTSSHKEAQQAMIDHLTDAETGCYLFKYFCDCYGNACFAIVKCWAADDIVYFEGTVYDNYRGFRQFQYNTVDGFTLDGCWVTLASFDEEIESLPTETKNVIDAIRETHSIALNGYKPSKFSYESLDDGNTWIIRRDYDETRQEALIPLAFDGSPVVTIVDEAFMNCYNLDKVIIPNSITSIGKFAFYNCSSLDKIIIPNSVTSIGIYAFYHCDNLTIYCEAHSKPDGWDAQWNPSNCPVVWGFANNFVDVNKKLAEIGTGGSGGATLSMPRIRFANYEYLEEVAYSYEQALCTRGRVVFSVNVQDGTLQEGDELQVCSMRSVFDKNKLRPILSRTITAEDIENLAKQPYLQISTDDFSGNSLGKNSMRALTSFHRTDSSTPEARKPKYIRIRRPVWKENKNGDVVVVNASFSNVVPIQFNLRCGSED